TRIETGIGQLVGTLPYMSPEQVAGDPGEIDARCDVYALGVVLFEMLAGCLPHDLERCPIPEAARIILDKPAPRLGALTPAFRGDVETIVAKALEKDKARGYGSAAELASDIRRYLTGLPIEARRDSALYVLRKRLRRYRETVIAASSLLALMIVFTAIATF